jgi:hypothetical protein
MYTVHKQQALPAVWTGIKQEIKSDNNGLGASVRDAGTETDILTEFMPGIFSKEPQESTVFGTYSSSG